MVIKSSDSMLIVPLYAILRLMQKCIKDAKMSIQQLNSKVNIKKLMLNIIVGNSREKTKKMSFLNLSLVVMWISTRRLEPFTSIRYFLLR